MIINTNRKHLNFLNMDYLGSFYNKLNIFALILRNIFCCFENIFRGLDLRFPHEVAIHLTEYY